MDLHNSRVPEACDFQNQINPRDKCIPVILSNKKISGCQAAISGHLIVLTMAFEASLATSSPLGIENDLASFMTSAVGFN